MFLIRGGQLLPSVTVPLNRAGTNEWVPIGVPAPPLIACPRHELRESHQAASLDLTADPANLHCLCSVITDFQVLSGKTD